MENEKRNLIDRDELIDSLGISDMEIFAKEVIGDAPTVDAVEVVRCEKCLYRSQYSDENGCYKCGGLQTEDGDLVLMVKPDFFCSYGERRTDNG